MTDFVGVKEMTRWIKDIGVEEVAAGMVDYLEEDFSRWEQFDKVARVASHTPFGVIELMPISDRDIYGFKYVNGHPSNPARGYQTVTAFGALADVHNGYPTFIAEMTILTALRTAATSAMAARHLARDNSTTLALIGTGSQAEFQALAFRSVLGINTLRVYDVDPVAVAKLVRNLTPLGFDIYVALDSSDAVNGADIVTTCTADKRAATVLQDKDVVGGMHLNAIGGDCPGKTELESSTLDRARVFVEYKPQTFIEGEIQNKSSDFRVTELWRVVGGAESGRNTPEEITLFDYVGFALEDFSALRYLRDRVQGTSHVTEIDLIAEPDDPKDLFGMTNSLLPV